MVPPIDPLLPAVRKALLQYRKRPLDRLSDLAGLSRETGDAVQSFGMGATEPLGAGKALNTARRGIEAWHGSPHKFDQFSLDKIGTGEGAQAYGHGLYFAENPKVAKGYREALSQPEVKIGDRTATVLRNLPGGVPPRLKTAEEEVAEAMAVFKDKAKARADLQMTLDSFRKSNDNPERQALLQRAVDLMDSQDIAVQQGGALYRVKLDVEPDELLDWDAPLARQPEKVRKVAQEFGMDATDHGYDELVKEAEAQAKDAFMRWKADPTDDKYREFLRADDDQRKIWNSRASSKSGKDVYREVGVRGDTEATRRLRERGILGIRYLDGGSRGAGEGTRNYVIFDPERIKILERLAMLGLGGQVVKDALAQARAAGGGQPQPPTLPPVTVTAPKRPTGNAAAGDSLEQIVMRRMARRGDR